LFEDFYAEFDGETQYRFQEIEKHFRDLARRQIDELRFRAAGMTAPEIVSVDLDDQPMTLSEHRGKVVLLSFWATWCGQCMKLIPHERQLVKQFQGQPFVIVGVNSDDNVYLARAAVAKKQISWRSFRDKRTNKPAISRDWKVLGFPTLYLIDHHGTIRKRWIGGPSPEELAHAIEITVDAARRKVPLSEMRPVVARLFQVQPPAAPQEKPKKITRRPDRGFLDKVYRAPDGTESKYVMFVPHSYDGTEAYPLLMYLHGAGSRGSDGKRPARPGYGLAKAILDRNEDFPFIAIFPQAREGEDWTAESAGGKRALAILDQVQKEYRIDMARMSLTGQSMGGQGTWSLAAQEPTRWAAIVPICHGWKSDKAEKLKDIPCWCFHGDADKVIPAQQSRDMIQAIKAVGGRPLYTEFGGVGHDDCVDRAYASPDLFEWLLLQKRPGS
jgi:thiol-disulfide isomerase/thioredoxin/dienelactone hydrolase